MNAISHAHLSDRELIDETVRAAGAERQSTSALIALLAEFDARRLYLGEGCSSLFTYCTQVLHLSEHAAYHRIEAARAARQFPVLLEALANGAVTLTTVALLRPHLTAENHRALLTNARHKSKREVEHQVAGLAPKPDARSLVRKVATPSGVAKPNAALELTDSGSGDLTPQSHAPGPWKAVPSTRPVIAALSTDRYLLRITLSRETHAKLRRAQDLLRHTIPSGDPAAIVDRALTMLIEHIERTQLAATTSPRSTSRSHGATRSGSRHVPAAVKRAVWSRDQGRCAFEGHRGRCSETGQLEFHHVVPFAAGGPTTAENLTLRCRAHNAYETNPTGPINPSRAIGVSQRNV